jgi:hypothetical protein
MTGLHDSASSGWLALHPSDLFPTLQLAAIERAAAQAWEVGRKAAMIAIVAPELEDKIFFSTRVDGAAQIAAELTSAIVGSVDVDVNSRAGEQSAPSCDGAEVFAQVLSEIEILQASLAGLTADHPADEVIESHHVARAKELAAADLAALAGYTPAGALSEPGNVSVVTVEGINLPAVPGRASCFKAVESVIDFSSGASTGNFIELMEVEIPTLEACARHLLVLGRAPLSQITDLARQCSDEGRHAQLLLNRGPIGPDRPDRSITVDHQLWYLVRDIPVGLAVVCHQRLGEVSGLGMLSRRAKASREAGDEERARELSAVLRDEIGHVMSGNKWGRRYAAELGIPFTELIKRAQAWRAETGIGNDVVLPEDVGLLRLAGFPEGDLIDEERTVRESG